MLYPLKFRPIFREYLWGGRRLGDVLAKPIGDAPKYAESWEVVDHGEDQSVVADGSIAGRTLSELIAEYGPALIGDVDTRQFPLLLKYLDCNRVLSVQVHPDDAYAQQMSPPDFGKTEAWYIVSAEPDAVIYAGLKDGVTADDLRAACSENRTEEVLHELKPSAGDCVFIPAGTVHALGAGLLVAEIQQSSDTTFRLFDWNRTDADGNARPLHIEQAVEVTDYDRGPIDFQTPVPLDDNGGERLVECDKFVLDRFRGSEPRQLGPGQRFHILTVVSGECELTWSETGTTELSLGESILIPAEIDGVELRGRDEHTTVLQMCLPN